MAARACGVGVEEMQPRIGDLLPDTARHVFALRSNGLYRAINDFRYPRSCSLESTQDVSVSSIDGQRAFAGAH